MPQQFSGVAAGYKRERYAVYRNLIERSVEAGITVDFVEIGDRNIVAGTLVFYQVPFPKNGGYAFFDLDIVRFPDNDTIDAQGLCGNR